MSLNISWRIDRGDEIGITRFSGHPSSRVVRVPIKSASEPAGRSVKSVSTAASGKRYPPPRQIRRRNNIVGCYDNRAASRRIASHRAKPPRKLALLHHNDFSRRPRVSSRHTLRPVPLLHTPPIVVGEYLSLSFSSLLPFSLSLSLTPSRDWLIQNLLDFPLDF